MAVFTRRNFRLVLGLMAWMLLLGVLPGGQARPAGAREPDGPFVRQEQETGGQKSGALDCSDPPAGVRAPDHG